MANLANAVTLNNSTAGSVSYKNNRSMTLVASNAANGGTISVVNATGTLTTSGAVTATGTGVAGVSLQTAGLLTINNNVSAANGSGACLLRVEA